ncbi:hypothetical protein OKW26_002892 [Paraburkholderia sp. 32]
MRQHRPDYSGKLVSHCDDDDVQWASLFHLFDPETWLFRAIDDAPRAVNQQSSEIRVTSLTNSL